MSGIQLVGNTNNTTIAEVEVNTKALRTTIRPIDYGSLGIYAVGATSGTIVAGTFTAAATCFSFRNPTGSTAIVLVKKVLLSAMGGSTAFTAGTGKFELFAARSFTAVDSGGTNLTPAAASNTEKLRTNMATTQLGGAAQQISISATGVVTPGTRTLDAQALGSVACMCSATASIVMVPDGTPLFDERVGEIPLVCAASEGFAIQCTTTATGTFAFSVSMVWEEVSAY